MECLLEDLINHIGQNMSDLEVVDEDYGQLEMLDQESRDSYPLTFPAVLIDASTVEWSNTGGLNQKGTATIRVRLVIDCYDDTHRHSGTTHLIALREAKRRELHKLQEPYDRLKHYNSYSSSLQPRRPLWSAPPLSPLLSYLRIPL